MANKKIRIAQIISVIISIIAMILSFIALNRDMYKVAYNDGFDGCIQENNLYERYEK